MQKYLSHTDSVTFIPLLQATAFFSTLIYLYFYWLFIAEYFVLFAYRLDAISLYFNLFLDYFSYSIALISLFAYLKKNNVFLFKCMNDMIYKISSVLYKLFFTNNKDNSRNVIF